MSDARPSPDPATWRLEERNTPFRTGAVGPVGHHVAVFNTRAVPRTGEEAELGTYGSMEAAEAACRAADEAEAGALLDLLWTFEAMGVGPRDVEIILRKAEECGDHTVGVAMDDLDCPYRFAATRAISASYFNGRPVGDYLGRTIMWWPKYGADGFAVGERV